MALLVGNNGNNKLKGTSGEDVLAGLGGNDTLDGGAGTDTAWFGGVASGYELGAGGGHLLVSDVAPVDGSDGIDTLISVEHVQTSSGQLTVSYGEFRLAAGTAGYHGSADVAGLATGGFVVTWDDVRPGAAGSVVYAQRFDTSGQAESSPYLVHPTDALQQASPGVTAGADGSFTVSWVPASVPLIGTQTQAYGSVGETSGDAIDVVFSTDGSQDTPVVATLASGAIVTSWAVSGQTVLSNGVYARVVGPDTDTGVFLVNPVPMNDAFDQGIAALSDGGFVIAWTATGAGDAGSGVHAQRFDAGGAKIGSDFLVNTTTTGTQSNATLAGLADGGFVATWQSDGQDGSGLGVYAQRYDDFGQTAGTEFQVNRFTTGNQRAPDLVDLAGGGFVIAWESQAQDGSGYGIYAQRYDAAGTTMGSEFRVNTSTAQDQADARLAALPDGGFLVEWTSFQNGATFDHFAQRYDAGGNATGLHVTGTSAGDVLNLAGGSDGLTVDGASGNDTINGSSGDDVLLGGFGGDQLKGNAGNDWLDGGGGADTMTGGAGDDDYVVDQPTDTIIEAAGGGNDTVHSSVTRTLGANLENLVLTGNGNIDGTGNAAGNVITGNSGDNRLDGGAGADLMAGGDGNDVYVVDSDGDIVSESTNGAPGTSTDLVESTLGFTLPSNIENLTLKGSAAINGTGNELGNALLGNAGANTLSGLGGDDALNGAAGNDTLNGGDGDDTLTGGAGADVLSGGAGHDRFVFASAPSASQVDTIGDFIHADDTISLSVSAFGALQAFGNQALPGTAFHAGTDNLAGDADDRIVYNTASGELFYDKDGAGGAAAVKVALLTGAPTLDASDFFVSA